MTERTSTWTAPQVYVSAAICLVLGVTLGYLFRGSGSPHPAVSVTAIPSGRDAGPHMPTLDQMKQMADKQAEPLLVKLKADPKNGALLARVGRIYESTHQFKEAADYYQRSLIVDPKNVIVRNETASCLYYTGDVDGALKQLNLSLKDDPKNPNALFNLGIIKWQAKQDSQGAVAAWKQLLKLNPTLEDAKKKQVQKLIADVSQNGAAAESNQLKE
ncbi:MAG TPA: tetratricopeptide repeat protein [Terriglobales bacterium]|nr:tetratricopeptide repeat protein [Terriglobales bacterium]